MKSGELRENDFAFVYLDVDDPRIAWLAYRGVINSADQKGANPGEISWHLVNTIQRGLISTLRREGLLEGFRLKQFGGALSRLRCIYAHPTLEAAMKATEGVGKFRKENLVAIEPRDPNFIREEYDSYWVTNFDALSSDQAAKNYWAHEHSNEPALELLLSGSFSILGTTVRKRAYETIKKVAPNSLAMLELARLAEMFSSDLGAIAPFIVMEENGPVLSSVIMYNEDEGNKVWSQALGRAKDDKTFQMNWDDIKPLTASDPKYDAYFSTPDFKGLNKSFRIEKANELKEFIDAVLE